MAEAKIRRTILCILKILLIIIICMLTFRFIVPMLMPFLLALLTARLLEPSIRFLIKKFNIRRSFAAVFCSVITIAAVLAIIIFTLLGLIRTLASLTDSIPRYITRFSEFYTSAEKCILNFIDSAPAELKSALDSTYDSVIQNISTIPSKLSAKLLKLVSSIISGAPDIMLFIVTYIISVFFFSTGYPTITGFMMHQLPEHFRDKAALFKSGLFGSICVWLRSQLILMLVTFSELSLSFLILKINSPLMIALLVTIVDALPVLGTGTVLIPWSILSFMNNNAALGAGLAVSYGIIYLVRSFLEPKIVGVQIGLHPLASLCSGYVGFRLAGIGGMILAPIILMMLKALNDNGLIRLWKNHSPK